MKKAKRKAKRNRGHSKGDRKPMADKFIVMSYNSLRDTWQHTLEPKLDAVYPKTRYPLKIYPDYPSALEMAKKLSMHHNRDYYVLGLRAVVGQKAVPVTIQEYR